MSNSFFRASNSLIKEWPEVFEGLYMSSMPIMYIDTVVLSFVDGRIWEIDIEDHKNVQESISYMILDTFKEYQEEITKIDFKINIEKLKIDIKNQTKDIL